MPKANNHVVGYSTVNNVDSRVHAFLSDGNVMKDLGTLAPSSSNRLEDQSFALGVNSADQIVGYTYLPGPNANTDPAWNKSRFAGRVCLVPRRDERSQHADRVGGGKVPPQF